MIRVKVQRVPVARAQVLQYNVLILGAAITKQKIGFKYWISEFCLKKYTYLKIFIVEMKKK